MNKLVLVLILALYACRNEKTIQVKNFDNSQVLVLVDRAVYPNHATVHVNGEIEGALDLTTTSAMGDTNTQVHKTVTGHIDTLIRGGDWYKDTIFLYLNPLTPVKGHLKFNYSIWSF